MDLLLLPIYVATPFVLLVFTGAMVYQAFTKEYDNKLFWMPVTFFYPLGAIAFYFFVYRNTKQ